MHPNDLSEVKYLIGKKHYPQILKKFESDPKRFDLNDFEVKLATAQCYQGLQGVDNYNSAITLLLSMLEPKHVIVYVTLARCYEAIGDLKNAKKYYDIIFKYYPVNKIVLLNYGRFLQNQGKLDKGIETYKRYPLWNLDKNFLMGIGHILQRQEGPFKLIEAIKIYSLVLNLIPDDVEALTEIARCKRKQKLIPDALIILKSIPERQKIPLTRTLQLNCLLLSNRYREAIVFWDSMQPDEQKKNPTLQPIVEQWRQKFQDKQTTTTKAKKPYRPKTQMQLEQRRNPTDLERKLQPRHTRGYVNAQVKPNAKKVTVDQGLDEAAKQLLDSRTILGGLRCGNSVKPSAKKQPSNQYTFFESKESGKQLKPQVEQFNHSQGGQFNLQGGQFNPQDGQFNPQYKQFNLQDEQFNLQGGQFYPQIEQEPGLCPWIQLPVAGMPTPFPPPTYFAISDIYGTVYYFPVMQFIQVPVTQFVPVPEVDPSQIAPAENMFRLFSDVPAMAHEPEQEEQLAYR